MYLEVVRCFNPLNQVYVFNKILSPRDSVTLQKARFNPLNQVYVFNSTTGTR